MTSLAGPARWSPWWPLDPYTRCYPPALNEPGIKPMGVRRFRLADGRVTERSIGIMGIEVRALGLIQSWSSVMKTRTY